MNFRKLENGHKDIFKLFWHNTLLNFSWWRFPLLHTASLGSVFTWHMHEATFVSARVHRGSLSVSVFTWYHQKMSYRNESYRHEFGLVAVPEPGFYLGFIAWGRSPDYPKGRSFLGGPGACPHGTCLKWICAEMQFSAFETQCYGRVLFYFLVVTTFWRWCYNT